MKNERIISLLLRLYPPAWRNEYGPELKALLERIPLNARSVANVVMHGAWQRIRIGEPWVLIGLPVMLLELTGLAAAILFAVPLHSPFQPEGLSVGAWLGLWLFSVTIMAGCGLWTEARGGGTLPHAGLQTVKMGLLVVSPLFLLAGLLTSGVLDTVVTGPGQTSATIARHGFAVVFYSPAGEALNTVLIAILGLAALADCWLLGALGGALGRSIRSRVPG